MIMLLSACGRCASGRYGPPYWLTAGIRWLSLSRARSEEAFADALGDYVSLVEERAMTHDVPAHKIIAASEKMMALFRAALAGGKEEE